MFKKCFHCNWNLPLFWFQVDRRPYKREHDKGRVKVCRRCTYNSFNKLGYAWLVNIDSNKFEKKIFSSKLDALITALNV